MAPSFSWWNNTKDTHSRTPVVIKMENPNWSMVELEGPSDEDFLISESPSRVCGKNAKQFTWVLLFKAHRAASCLTSVGSAMLGLASAIRRRVASGQMDTDADVQPHDVKEVENPVVCSRFYFCIKMFLCLLVLLLGFEVAAYFKGWHFGPAHLQLEYIWKEEGGRKEKKSKKKKKRDLQRRGGRRKTPSSSSGLGTGEERVFFFIIILIFLVTHGAQSLSTWAPRHHLTEELTV